MENEVKTYTDYTWDQRINSLVNCLVYNHPVPEKTNRYELEAAKLIIRWQEREPMKEFEPSTKPTLKFKAVKGWQP